MAHPGEGADEPAERVTRSTRQGAAVEQVLAAADGFRTAQQVFAAAVSAGHRIGLTTVYRHLNALAESGRVDVVHREDGEAQFRLCGTAADGGHHHHVVCRVCGRSEEVLGPEVEAWAARVARSAGFSEVTHTVEVFGRCPRHSQPRAVMR